MTEAPVLHGSTALRATAPVRTVSHLRLVPAHPSARQHADRTRASRPPAAHRPIILTRRGRLVLVGLPIALGVTALILLGAFLTSQAQAGVAPAVPSTVVEVNATAGETLWDIAVEYAPERDPREVVAELVELNDLRTSVIQAGQSISVPSRA